MYRSHPCCLCSFSQSGGAEGSTSPPTKRSHDGDEAAAKDADAGGQGGAGEGDEAGAVGDADVEGGVGAAGVEGEGEGGEGAVAEEGAGEGLGVAAAGAAAPALGGAADASAGVGLGEADPLPGPRGGGGRAREGTAGRHRALDPILPVTGEWRWTVCAAKGWRGCPCTHTRTPLLIPPSQARAWWRASPTSTACLGCSTCARCW